MLKEFVFWALFASVMLGIVLTLMRNYRQARAREMELEALHAKVLADAVGTKAALAAEARIPSVQRSAMDPGASQNTDLAANAVAGSANEPAPEAFDPTKTRLFVRADAAPMTANGLSGVPSLICLGGRQKGLRFSIPALGLTIGRADDNIVIIIDGRVSAHHAWIGMVGGQPMLRDYQSLNGTFLNEKLDVAVSEAALGNGDIIQFGGAGGDQYRFVIE